MFAATRRLASASQTGQPTRVRSRVESEQPQHQLPATTTRRASLRDHGRQAETWRQQQQQQHLRRSERLRTRCDITPPAASGASVLATPPAAMPSATRATATAVPDTACPASPADSLPAYSESSKAPKGSPRRRRLAGPLRNRGAPALLCPQLRRCSGTPMVCLTRPPWRCTIQPNF